MRLLIIDDHTLFREGLTALLKRDNQTVHICEAGSLAEGQRLQQHEVPRFDFILLDLNLNEMKPETTIEAIPTFAGTPVVVLSAVSDPRLVWRTVEAGAVGFIPKSLSFVEFSAALGRSLAGKIYLPQMSINEGLRDIKSKRRADYTGKDGVAASIAQLSPRQLEILRLLVYGLSNREIGERLSISQGTVKTHVGHLLTTLGVNTRTEAVYLLAQVEHSIAQPDADAQQPAP